MKRIILTGLVLLSSMFSFNAMAQLSDEDAADAVAKRQAVYKLLSFSNGPLGTMARGAEFDRAVAIKGTERIVMLAGFIPEMFVIDTRENGGFITRASTIIWDNLEEFTGYAADLAAGAQAAIEILNSDDGTARAAIEQIGPKCGACHDRFRLDPPD